MSPKRPYQYFYGRQIKNKKKKKPVKRSCDEEESLRILLLEEPLPFKELFSSCTKTSTPEQLNTDTEPLDTVSKNFTLESLNALIKNFTPESLNTVTGTKDDTGTPEPLDTIDDIFTEEPVDTNNDTFTPEPVEYQFIGRRKLHHYTPIDYDEHSQPEGLNVICDNSGLSIDMGVKMLQVLGKEAALLNLDAIALSPPVTFLRTNTLKGCRKLIWLDIEASNINAWLPRWSRTIIIALSPPRPLNPKLERIVSRGLCIQPYEREWQRVDSVWVAGNSYSTDWHTDFRNAKLKDDSAEEEIQPVSVFYSAKGSISSLVVLALAAKENDDVLELCATASGKTSHIASHMMNSGTLVSNTLELCEARSLEDSLEQMGVKNCAVTCVPPGAIALKKQRSFSRVLVDVPSSGVGVVPKSKSNRPCLSGDQLLNITMIQKELIRSGAECLKQDTFVDSYLVYTTSSVLVEENEFIVESLLKERPDLKLISTGIEIGTPGFTSYGKKRFPSDMALTQRIYSHQQHFDGCFIAKFMLESDIRNETNAFNKLRVQNQLEVQYLKEHLLLVEEEEEKILKEEAEKEQFALDNEKKKQEGTEKEISKKEIEN